MIKRLWILSSIGLFVVVLGFVPPIAESGQNVAKLVNKDGVQRLVIAGQLAPPIYARHGPKFQVGPDLWVSTNRVYNKSQSDLTLFRGEKAIARLDLAEVARRWTQDDKIWGSHQEANEMRYLRAGVTLRPQLSEAIPERGGTALAILDYMGELTQSPTLNAHLVRIDLRHFSIKPLRWLGASQDWSNSSQWIQRFYRCDSNLFVVDGTKLLKVSPSGSSKNWATLPFGTVGLAGGHCLVMSGLDERRSPRRRMVVALDLRNGKRKTLAALPGGDGQNAPWATNVKTYPSSGYFTYDTIVPQVKPGGVYRGDNYRLDSCAINVETGRKTPVPHQVQCVGEYAFCDSWIAVGYPGVSTTGAPPPVPPKDHAYLIYSLRTGKLVQKLKLPAGLK